MTLFIDLYYDRYGYFFETLLGWKCLYVCDIVKTEKEGIYSK